VTARGCQGGGQSGEQEKHQDDHDTSLKEESDGQSFNKTSSSLYHTAPLQLTSLADAGEAS
jgi:hypothetical protein